MQQRSVSRQAVPADEAKPPEDARGAGFYSPLRHQLRLFHYRLIERFRSDRQTWVRHSLGFDTALGSTDAGIGKSGFISVDVIVCLFCGFSTVFLTETCSAPNCMPSHRPAPNTARTKPATPIARTILLIGFLSLRFRAIDRFQKGLPSHALQCSLCLLVQLDANTRRASDITST